MAKTLATQRTLKLFRDDGWQCAIVEKWLPPRGAMKFGIRQDVWGFGDILASRMDEYGNPCLICAGTGERESLSTNAFYVCDACAGSGKVIVKRRSTALIQCFPDSGGNAGFSAHRKKVMAIKEAENWLRAGNRIFLVGWRPKPKRDTGPGRWRWKQEEVVLSA